MASSFMIHPLLARLAALSGLYHDAGKYQEEFQRYLRKELSGRVDHATLGGQLLAQRITQLPPAFVAAPIFGHHGGLPNAVHRKDRRPMAERLQDPIPQGAAEAFGKELPQAGQFPPLPPSSLRPVADNAFALEFFMAIRMVYSALVDADFLDTEKYFDPFQAALRGKRPALGELWDRYWEYMRELSAKGSQMVREKRAQVLAQCLAAAEGFQPLFPVCAHGRWQNPVLFGFALRHAQVHPTISGSSTPFPTSIIEQNATYSARQWGRTRCWSTSALAPPEGTPTDRAAENWDAPLVVTTNVQLFESLFSTFPGAGNCTTFRIPSSFWTRCVLPDAVLRPCLMALSPWR